MAFHSIHPDSQAEAGMDASAVRATIAICDVDGNTSDSIEVSFSVDEYLMLGSGELLLVRGGLGWSIGFSRTVREGSSPAIGLNPLSMTATEVIDELLGLVVIPEEDDEHDANEPHPWEELAWLARRRGVDIDRDTLKALPYRVFLSDKVLAWVSDE